MRNKAEIMDRLRTLQSEASDAYDKCDKANILRAYHAGQDDAYKRALIEVDWLPDPQEVSR